MLLVVVLPPWWRECNPRRSFDKWDVKKGVSWCKSFGLSSTFYLPPLGDQKTNAHSLRVSELHLWWLLIVVWPSCRMGCFAFFLMSLWALDVGLGFPLLVKRFQTLDAQNVKWVLGCDWNAEIGTCRERLLLASLPGLWVEGGWLTLVSVVVALLSGLGDDLLRGTLVGKRLTCLVRLCAIVNNEREVFLYFGCWNLAIPPVGRWLPGVISSLKGEFWTVVLGCVVVCKKGLTIELIGWGVVLVGLHVGDEGYPNPPEKSRDDLAGLSSETWLGMKDWLVV